MLRKIYLLSLLIFTSFYAKGQIAIYADPITANAGDNFKVSIKVNKFIDVSSFQFAIKWDPSRFSYVSLADLQNLGMNENSDFNIMASNGTILVIWAHPSSESSDLADGSTLFSINFNAICGSTSPLQITTDGEFFPIQFTDEFGDPINFTKQDGSVTITGTPCGGQQSVLKAGTVNGTSGNQICVPIIAGSGFTNITGLTANLNLSSSCANFNSTGNYNTLLTGLGSGSFNTSQAANGIITLQWTGSVPTTLTPGATVFEICYTPTESCCDQQAPLTFSNINFTTSGGGSNNLAESGGINITCGGGGDDCNPTGLAFIGSEECGLQGTEVTVGVRAQGFKDIFAMQFSVDWDPNQLELVNDGIIIPAINPIPGFSSGKFGPVINGCMRALWDEPNQIPTSVPDGTLIFSLKFRVLGANGTQAKVNFGGHCIDGGEVFVTPNGELDFTNCPGTVKIEECATLAINNVNVSNASCNAVCDGSISFNVVGGNNPVITWSQSGLSGSSVTGLCAGSYSVTVTSGANTVTNTFTVTEPAAIVISTVSVTPATSGNNGAIDINVTGGGGTYTYNWSNGAATQDLTGVPAGNYTVTVTDAISKCTKTQTFTVNSGNEPFSVNIQSRKFGTFDLSCFGECDGELTALVTSGSAPFTYKWSSSNQTTQTITGLCAGNYSVTVTDATGATATKAYTLLVPEKIAVNFDVTYPTDELTSDGRIEANASGGTAPYNYSWTGTIVTSGNVLSNIGIGTYVLTVQDASGCSATYTEHLTPGGKDCYQGIGAITPNGDGKNDRLLITCVSSVNNKFSVFNRWGQLVYNTTNYNNDWEGTSNTGEILPDGGYYWVLEIVKLNASNEIHKGAVSIIKSLR